MYFNKKHMTTPRQLDEKDLIKKWSITGLLDTATNKGLIARCFEIATEYIFSHEQEFSEILTVILPIIVRLLITHDGNLSNEQLEKYVHELIPDIKEAYDNTMPVNGGYEQLFCESFADTYKKTP